MKVRASFDHCLQFESAGGCLNLNAVLQQINAASKQSYPTDSFALNLLFILITRVASDSDPSQSYTVL